MKIGCDWFFVVVGYHGDWRRVKYRVKIEIKDGIKIVEGIIKVRMLQLMEAGNAVCCCWWWCCCHLADEM